MTYKAPKVTVASGPTTVDMATGEVFVADEMVSTSAPTITKAPVGHSEKPTAVYSEEGQVVKSAISVRDMISKSEALKIISSLEAGQGKWIGRVIGVCIGTFTKENVLPDGKKVESIGLSGMFEIEKPDGTRITATKIYMPGSAYGLEMHTLFASSPDTMSVEVDCDVGISATGKAIPYEYVVRTHIRHDLQAELRGRRKPVWGTIAPLQPSLALTQD